MRGGFFFGRGWVGCGLGGALECRVMLMYWKVWFGCRCYGCWMLLLEG